MTGEERVAFLEAQMEAQKQKSDNLSEQIRELDRKLEKRADGIDAEIKALDTKFDEKFGGLSNRLDNHFKWLVGINVTMWAHIPNLQFFPPVQRVVSFQHHRYSY